MSKPTLPICILMAVLLAGAGYAQSPQAVSPGKPFALPPLDELRATRERPLFSPSRQPDAAPEGESETPVMEESPDSVSYELTGVVIGTDVQVAIFKNRDTQETVHLRQGENLDAWSIEEIAQRHVILRQDDRQITMELFRDKSPLGVGTPTPAPLLPMRTVPRTNATQLDPVQGRRNIQAGQMQKMTPAQRRALRRNLQNRRQFNDDNSGGRRR